MSLPAARPCAYLPLMLLASAVLALSAGPAQARAACRAGRTVLHNRQARVYVRGARRVGKYFGCLRASGPAFRLNPHGSFDDFHDALAGTMVAFQSEPTNLHATEVVVRSLRTGRVVHRASANRAGEGPAFQGPADEIVVARSGAVAWLACVTIGQADSFCRQTEVHAIGSRGGHRILDVQPSPAVKALRLTDGGHTVKWTVAGSARSVSLG